MLPTKKMFSNDGEVVAEVEDTEDWHAKRTFLMVNIECIFVYLIECPPGCLQEILYKRSSQAEKGTLSQLKMLINCSVNTDTATNMKACEDLMLITLHSHNVAASKSILSTMQFEKVQDLAREIIVRYIYFNPNIKVTTKDKKYLYGMQVLTLTLLWHGFNDAI